MKVSSAMSQEKLSVTPWTRVRDAAAIMRERNIAALPVLVDDRPFGIVTDHDIVVRLFPEARDAGDRPVRDAMSRNFVSCLADQDIAEAADLLEPMLASG